MATTVITGRQVSFTVESTNYDAQATSATLTVTNERQAFETLDGTAYKTVNKSATFDIELLADWGATGSVCEALWTAAESPDTTLTVSLTSNTGAVFAFEVFPEFPSAGGAGTDAQTVSLSLTVEGGNITETFS